MKKFFIKLYRRKGMLLAMKLVPELISEAPTDAVNDMTLLLTGKKKERKKKCF